MSRTPWGEPGPPTRTQEAVDQTHPGFTITCQKCGSGLVYVESDLGYSSLSGSWGSVRLVCDACDQTTDIYEAG